ncbi:MAG: hypothetical protein VXZ82_22115 [Planctomycetota bacterium]|nr:hypothetical protein [Planctomycetota bacterium]
MKKFHLVQTISRFAMNASGQLLCLAALVLLVGCAANKVCRTSPDYCPDYGAVSCLPSTAGAATPGATLANWQRCAEEMPAEAVPAPPGAYVTAWRESQWAGAKQSEWVIPRNEWFSGGDQLGPDGINHVDRLTGVMLQDPNWIVLEAEPVALKQGESYEEALQRTADLQANRRDLVVRHLMAGGVTDAADWVIFAEDRSIGVRGIEAPIIFNRQFQGFGQGNRGGGRRGRGQGGFGGGLGGGFGGGGFGGGGFGGGGFGGGGFGGGGIF